MTKAVLSMLMKLPSALIQYQRIMCVGKEAKEVKVLNVAHDKLRITACLAVTLSGRVLPPMAIAKSARGLAEEHPGVTHHII